MTWDIMRDARVHGRNVLGDGDWHQSPSVVRGDAALLGGAPSSDVVKSGTWDAMFDGSTADLVVGSDGVVRGGAQAGDGLNR